MAIAVARVARGALTLTLALIVGCTLAVDASEVNDGCGPDARMCDNRCARNDDPAFGCKPTRCEPCTLPNAIPKCEAGECEVSACLFGFGCVDCHANLMTDEFNCGECGNACEGPTHCVDRQCVPLR